MSVKALWCFTLFGERRPLKGSADCMCDLVWSARNSQVDGILKSESKLPNSEGIFRSRNRFGSGSGTKAQERHGRHPEVRWRTGTPVPPMVEYNSSTSAPGLDFADPHRPAHSALVVR